MDEDRRAISPLISSILLMLIATSASLVIYSWVASYPMPQETTSARLIRDFKMVEAAYNQSSQELKLYVLNTGGAEVIVDYVYVYSISNELIDARELSEPLLIEPGELEALAIANLRLDPSSVYKVRLSSTHGIVAEELVRLTMLPYAPPAVEKHYRAVIAYYAFPNGDRPRFREWNASLWSGEELLSSTGATVYNVKVATCPLSARSYEVIVAASSSDGYLHAYVWNGSSWASFIRIAYVGDQYSYEAFDIAYETLSGRALLAYFKAGSASELGYRVWDGSSWSDEGTYDLAPATGRLRFINLAPNPRSNEIALICIVEQLTVPKVYPAYGAIWNGSSWAQRLQLSSNVITATEECVAVAYETLSGRALFAWGDGSRPDNVSSIVWNGSSWLSGSSVHIGNNPRWITLKPNPASNEVMLTCTTVNNRLNTAIWNGSSWADSVMHDYPIETAGARCADFDWEPDGKGGLLVWGHRNVDSLTYRVWDGGSWGDIKSYSGLTTDQQWVQVKHNFESANVTIMVATVDDRNYLIVTEWNGSAVVSQTVLTTSSSYSSCERFELEFKHFRE